MKAEPDKLKPQLQEEPELRPHRQPRPLNRLQRWSNMIKKLALLFLLISAKLSAGYELAIIHNNSVNLPRDEEFFYCKQIGQSMLDAGVFNNFSADQDYESDVIIIKILKLNKKWIKFRFADMYDPDYTWNNFHLAYAHEEKDGWVFDTMGNSDDKWLSQMDIPRYIR
jgi:hypothetical protein